jgi:hypothetical protein
MTKNEQKNQTVSIISFLIDMLVCDGQSREGTKTQ